MEVEVVRFKANEGVYDTGDEYYLENVSYGLGYEISLSNFVTIKFEDNEITTTRIDERNLILCQYLSLHKASTIVCLDTSFLMNLRILNLN